MEWTDCRVIEQVFGRMSGAPVLRHSRVRPQDIISNIDLGAEWIAAAHGLAIEDVREVLAFYRAHRDTLPLEFVSSERIAALGADGIDWSACPDIELTAAGPMICGTPVRPIDLIIHLEEGAEALARSYRLPRATVDAVLSTYALHQRQLAPAV